MLAEAIVVPDGDSFLQEPIDLLVPGLPKLPPLTYTQMAVLQATLERMLLTHRVPRAPRTRIEDPRLPKLPLLDSAERAQLKMHLELILKEA